MNEPVAGTLKAPVSARSARCATPFGLCWWTAVILTATGVGAGYVYFTIFSRFQAYDDEGFILISLKAFFQGKPLYDEVYSSFQPGFYVLHWLLFTVLDCSLDHDSIRLVTLVFWLAAAALNGLLAYRLTARPVLGLLVGILTARSLQPFANEPGHPQALAYLLVASVVALFAFADLIAPRRFAIAVGTLTGILLLIKINVGVFLLLPIALIFAANHTSKAGRYLGIGIGLLMLSLPAILWRAQLAAPGTPLWTLGLLELMALLLVVSCGLARRHSIWLLLPAFLVCATVSFETETSVTALPVFNTGLLALSIAAAVRLCLARPARVPESADAMTAPIWGWALLSAVIAAGVILGITLLRGTTLAGLAAGLFWWPAKVSTSFLIRPRANWLGPMLGLLGAAACCAYLFCQGPCAQRRYFRAALALTQISFGLLVLAEFYWRREGSSTLMPLRDELPHFWMLPFAWLAGVESNGSETRRPGRLALVIVAVMQPLIACPVAGTQLVPASMVLPVLAAVCLGTGLQSFGLSKRLPDPERWRPIFETVASIALLILFASETTGMAKTYAALKPLDLPGAQRIRLTADEVRIYHQVISEVARPEVNTFLTLPGLDSFYFWAKKDPPNSLNVSAWILLLDDQSQEKIWQAAKSRPGLMVIRNRRLIRSWVGGRSIAPLPLVRHIEENFTTLTNYGGYELMIRRQP